MSSRKNQSRSSGAKRAASEITPAPPPAAPEADLPPPPKRSKKEVPAHYFEDIPPWDKSKHRIYVWNVAEGLDQGDAEKVGNTMHSKKIRRMHFYNHTVPDRDLIPLSKGIMGHPSLEDVQFTNCRVGDGGAAAIAEALKHPRCRIYKLDLSNNRIGHKGFLALAEAAAANRSLTTLKLADNLHPKAVDPERPSGWVADFVSTLARSPSLRKVDLSDNTFSHDEAAELFTVWAAKGRARSLNISGVPRVLSDGSKALDAFMTLLATPEGCPRHIKLKYTGVSKKFWEGLPKAVEQNPRLYQIEIKERRRSDDEYPYGIPTEDAYKLARKISNDAFDRRGEDGKCLIITLSTNV